MDVISGMAPRPSTPQGLPSGKSGPRSLSAPNSPARSVPGNIPGISRLPSQDSLDRSIHNELGNGKSTAQIIRDLKHANASLSAKLSTEEANFMNQLSEVTRSFEDQRMKMDEDIRSMKKQLAHLEAYKAAADSKLKEKDAALSKVKEESAFQRHSISDLKNQLYQLQTELDDSQQPDGSMIPRGIQEDMQQLLADNQEMARELSQMQSELRDSERARHELERNMRYGKPPAPPSSNSGESSGGYYHKYQETHSELERHRKRLSVTQTKVEGLEAEKQSLREAHAQTIEELQAELVKQSEVFQRREQDLLSKIDALEFTDSQVSVNLKSEISQRDDEIAALQDEIDRYGEKIDDLSTQLSQAQQAAASQEHYRRDEAEDLRILHDAQEEEIQQLRKQVEEARKELEMRDVEMKESDSSERGLPGSQAALEKAQRELLDTKEKLVEAEKQLAILEKSSEAVSETQDELQASKQRVLDVQEELSKVARDDEIKTKELAASMESLIAENSKLSEELEILKKEKSAALRKFEEKNSEFSQLRSHWEGRAGAANVAETLKTEIEIHRQHAIDASERERAATSKLQDLSEKVTSLENLLIKERKAADEAKVKLEESVINSANSQDGEALSKAQTELEELRKSIQTHEANAHKNAKQLREAQIALVALDDEKKAMSEKHRELLMAVEKKKEEIQATSDDRIKAKEIEIQALKQQMGELGSEEAAQITKIKDRLLEAEALEAVEIKRLRDQLASLRAEKTDYPKTQTLESSSRAVPVSPEHSVGAASTQNILQKDDTIRSLKNENEVLKTKLKDRDTTISALVRSSVSLESKIAGMSSESSDARSVQSEEKKATEAELYSAQQKSRDTKTMQEMTALKKELKLAKQDANRWKIALEETGGSGSDYRYQISMLHKELDESVERLKERDQAIENLVNQSISQDAHVKDLKNRLSSLMKEMEKRRSYGGGILEAEVERLRSETEMFAGQIIEQDEEIQNLKRRLEQRDDQVQLFKQELADLRVRVESANSSTESLEEVERLKRDVSRITLDLRARDEEIEYLQKKLEDTPQKMSVSGSSEVASLQAELDELKEASQDNISELRDLRKQLWEAKQAAGEANDLKIELAQAQYAFEEYKRTQSQASDSNKDNETIEKLTLDLKERESKIAELESTASSVNDHELNGLKEAIEDSRKELIAKTKEIERLNEDIKSRNASIQKGEAIKLKILGELSDTKDALKNLQGQTSENMRSIEVFDGEKATLLREKEELSKANESMFKQVADLEKQIESLEDMQKRQQELKFELEKAQEARAASEKSLVDAYEKRIAALNNDKDRAVDELRGELTAARGQKSEEIEEMSRQCKFVESENTSLREQFDVELDAKNQQIYALEHTLHAQEQIVQSMRAEMDQLQSGMERATEKRRGEVEDLQQELMQLEGRALKQERDITALKMELEESKLEHKSEVVQLKEALATAEKESPLTKTMASLQNDDRMLQVKERLEQLKARNTALQEENLKLGGRLERKVIEVKSLEFEKSRAEELEHENHSLRRQVQELGSILESARPKSRSSSSKKQPAPKAQAPATASTAPDNKSSTEKPVKSKKGLKGLFKRREVTVIHEGDED